MEEIINSVMQSPENTNPNVLRSQLQSVGSSSGGAMVVNMTIDGNSAIVDKTVAEIHSAAQNGCVIFVGDMGGDYLPAIGILESIIYDDSHYQAYIIETGIGKLYARAESDYPGTALS